MLVLALLILIISLLAAYGFTHLVIQVARGSAHETLRMQRKPMDD